MLIQHARAQSGGLVGRDIHIDGTEAETNARFAHDCQDDEDCARRASGRSRVRGNPIYPDRVPAREQRATRHKLARENEPEEEILDLGDAEDYVVDEIDHTARVRLNGCWYRSLDGDAGVRSYRRSDGSIQKVWHGFYNLKAVDHYTGVPVAIDVTSSSVNEHVSYPDLLDKTISAIGDKPRAVVGDRGFSIGAVFERNTREGIASVFPYRKFGQIDRADLDTERYDRYGVPRCQHCGGESMFVRFNAEPSPRMWFECSDQTIPECAREQAISCSHNWRLLLPLWRTSEAYWALKESHGEYERVHHLWRGRYRVGGDTHISRPKRISIGWQQLRANAAILIEWLRVLDRQGWLGSARRNPNTDRRRDVPRAYARFLRLRERFRLNLPYGPRAEALGLTGRPPHLPGAGPPGDDTPPF